MNFETPVKRIQSEQDVRTFQKTVAHARLVDYIRSANAAVLGKSCTDSELVPSNRVQILLALLETIEEWISEIPAQKGPRRFGNVAFRKWMLRLEENKESLLRPVVGTGIDVGAVGELAPYFTGSFGSSQRLDYGTGHELSFAAFLAALLFLGVLQREDEQALILLVFKKYLEVVHALISTYNLEPAGSHGVWGLDDHSALPYMFGASQMAGLANGVPPSSVMDLKVVDTESKSNLYFAAIAFIYKGPFFEHSPMLYDISGVESWTKINNMYSAEVLGKFPVVQHFPFGPVLFPFEEATQGKEP